MWKMICASRCQDTSEGSMVVIWAPNRKESIEAREEDNEQTDIVRSVRGFSVTRRLRTLRFWPRNSLLFSQMRRSALPGQRVLTTKETNSLFGRKPVRLIRHSAEYCRSQGKWRHPVILFSDYFRETRDCYTW